MIQENTPDALPFPILTLTAETIDPTPIMTLSKPFPTQVILSELTQLLPTTPVMLLKNTSIQTLPEHPRQNKEELYPHDNLGVVHLSPQPDTLRGREPQGALHPGEDTVEVTRIVNSTNDQQGDQEDMPTTQFYQEPVHPITGRTEPSGGDKATAIGSTYDISD